MRSKWLPLLLSLSSDPLLDSSLNPPMQRVLAQDQERLMPRADVSVSVCVCVAVSVKGAGAV